ncbi:MAG: 30S ribosomal protein S4 [Candidatus Campbellbacteria bacterium]|nr:30S ribosomal protein S4 [Candidatus Campbellbacteria bacterium]
MLTSPKYKICRRLGSHIYEKCQTQKFQLAEARKGKMQRHGRRRNVSEYGEQLLEKQRVRYTYGLREKQFSRYVKEASETTGAVPAEILFQTLERRLDNAVYKLGLAPSRAFARQLVSHGHIKINNRKIDIPSYQVKVDDVISVKDSTKEKNIFDIIQGRLENYKQPNWLSFDPKKFEGKVTSLPKMEAHELGFDLSSVIQFYSR